MASRNKDTIGWYCMQQTARFYHDTMKVHAFDLERTSHLWTRLSKGALQSVYAQEIWWTTHVQPVVNLELTDALDTTIMYLLYGRPRFCDLTSALGVISLNLSNALAFNCRVGAPVSCAPVLLDDPRPVAWAGGYSVRE